MSETYGPNVSGLFDSLDPVGACLKTSLACSLRCLGRCVTTWRERVTRSGHWYLVLTTSAHRTEEKGSGSWPTIRASDAEHSGPNQRDKAGNPALMGAVAKQWLTPHGMTGQDQTGKAGAGGEFDKQVKQWMAPEAQNQEGYQAVNGKQIPRLGKQVKQWASPQRSDHKGPNLTTESYGSGHGLPAQASRSTNGNIQGSRDWMTPRGQEAAGGFQRTTTGRSIEMATQLSTQVGLEVQQKQSAKLNPKWVAQLQGFPEGWLDLDETS